MKLYIEPCLALPHLFYEKIQRLKRKPLHFQNLSKIILVDEFFLTVPDTNPRFI